MVINTSDNTIGICEGMVWVGMEDVADELGVGNKEREDVIAWLGENISDWNDQLMDDIVDFAISAVAGIVRQELGVGNEQ